MTDKHLLQRTALSHTPDMSYKLEFLETEKPAIGHCRRETEITGRIYYVVGGKKIGLMTWGTPWDVRVSWHGLCRLNRARNAGRPYLHIIHCKDPRRRRVLGRPSLKPIH